MIYTINSRLTIAETELHANDSQIKENTENIAKNKTAIEANTADIQTNSSNIAENKTAIEANTAAIQTNSSNIAKNKTAIEANTAAIQTNSSNIAENKTAIEQNSAWIERVEDIAKRHATVVEGSNVVITTATNDQGGTEYTVNVAKDLQDLNSIETKVLSATEANVGGVNVSNGQIIGEKYAITNDGGAVLASGAVKIDGDGTLRAGNDNFTVYSDGTTVVKSASNMMVVTNGGIGLSAENGLSQIAVTQEGVGIKGGNNSSVVASDAGVSVTSYGNGLISNSTGTTLAGGNTKVSISDAGVNLNGARLSGVADGVNDFDAVNMRQLRGLERNINRVETLASRGIAGVAALASIPQVEQGKTFSLGAGVGSYNGYQAIAIGGSGRITQNTIVKASVATSAHGKPTFGAGISYSW